MDVPVKENHFLEQVFKLSMQAQLMLASSCGATQIQNIKHILLVFSSSKKFPSQARFC